jgi:hypothetical protein
VGPVRSRNVIVDALACLGRVSEVPLFGLVEQLALVSDEARDDGLLASFLSLSFVLF